MLFCEEHKLNACVAAAAAQRDIADSVEGGLSAAAVNCYQVVPELA
jgi:hypothetical protein